MPKKNNEIAVPIGSKPDLPLRRKQVAPWRGEISANDDSLIRFSANRVRLLLRNRKMGDSLCNFSYHFLYIVLQCCSLSLSLVASPQLSTLSLATTENDRSFDRVDSKLTAF